MGSDNCSGEGSKSFWEKYLLNYINYSKVEGMNDNPLYYEKLNYENKNYISDSPIVFLNDGTFFYPDECGEIILYDTNGDKGPNQIGRDIFRFFILIMGDVSQNGEGEEQQFAKAPHFNTLGYNLTAYAPDVFPRYTRTYVKNSCANDGYYCTYLLQLDGWEFKDDYPLKL